MKCCTVDVRGTRLILHLKVLLVCVSAGNVSVGNLPRFLPFVLQEIEEQPKRQYLLLHSLKEIISCQSVNQQAIDTLKTYVESIW